MPHTILGTKRQRLAYALLVVGLVVTISFAVGVEPSEACPCEGVTNYYSSSSQTELVGQVGFCCGTCDWGCSWGDETFWQLDYPHGCV